MVYGYNTNKDFIENTQALLNKLEEGGVWDKDTLVIGLDKGVRPLAYTIRKLSKEEGKETPDIRFFNYSAHSEFGAGKVRGISDYIKGQIDSNTKKPVDPNKFSKYKKVLILDEHVWSGNSLKNAKKIFEEYFHNSERKPEISMAFLGYADQRHFPNKFDREAIHTDRKKVQSSSFTTTGIVDKVFTDEQPLIHESKRISDKDHYNRFVGNRKQLSRDINQYIHEMNESSPAGRTLERAVQTVSLVAFFGGVVLGYKSITGNVIGSANSVNILGIVLIVLGILGLVVFRKVKK